MSRITAVGAGAEVPCLGLGLRARAKVVRSKGLRTQQSEHEKHVSNRFFDLLRAHKLCNRFYRRNEALKFFLRETNATLRARQK